MNGWTRRTGAAYDRARDVLRVAVSVEVRSCAAAQLTREGHSMKALWLPVAGAFALAMTSLAVLPATTQAQQSVTINLSPQNDSGQTGTAVLTPDGAGTKVVLTLANAPGPHPAHIHTGSCPTPGAVVFPLTSVTDGKSETTVAASIADIMKAPHAINIHKSPQEIPVYTSCGNVSAPAAGAAASPVAAAPAAQPSPAAKPAAPPAAAAQPVAAPAQAPRPVASPAALPRTGDVDPNAGLWMVIVAGVGLLGAGALVLARRRSSV
jgi:LPXTG-motif cell wall-anchored protein